LLPFRYFSHSTIKSERDEFGADIAAVDPIELVAAVNGAVEREASEEIPSNSDPQLYGKSGLAKQPDRLGHVEGRRH
jgi:hypothetical protein